MKIVDRFRTARPWGVGLLFALLPLVWLWSAYPIRWDTRAYSGTITGSAIARHDQTVVSAGYGTASVRCYQMALTYVFDTGTGVRTGVQLAESCDLGWLKRYQASLQNRRITVLYSPGGAAQPVVVELISSVKIKLAAGLSVAFFLLAGWMSGIAMGRFSSRVFSLNVREIAPRYFLYSGLLALFYVCLILG